MADQLPLLGPRGGIAPRVPPPPWEQPFVAVVAVAVESPLPHLDRTFDYGVTAEQAESAQVGVRVRVRLAGTQYDGRWVA